MAKQLTAHDLASQRRFELKDALSKQHQFIWPTEPTQKTLDGVPYWCTTVDHPVKFPDSSTRSKPVGTWTIHGYWRYWSLGSVAMGEATLMDSSVGLSVAEHGIAGVPDKFCVARYDTELYGEQRGRHLNVFQPVIKDSIHWAIPDDIVRRTDWPTEPMLRFLIEVVPDELIAAGWPT